MSNGKGPLYEMTLKTPTEFWNDSCSTAELSDAIGYGATGGTSNPTERAREQNRERQRIQASPKLHQV
jgi:hypothetical protein